jgi:hypothetical protein
MVFIYDVDRPEKLVPFDGSRFSVQRFRLQESAVSVLWLRFFGDAL